MIKYLSIFVVGLLFCFSLFGQTEAEILSQANKLFKSEKFVEATPLYLRLLTLAPKSNEYNFRYGACLLYNGDKKQEALRYLKYATENPNIDPEAHYYLGKAYHYNYLFNDAVRSYNKFEELVGVKTADNYQINRLIETCQNGRKLLMNYSDMVVFEKKEIESDKFFRLYDTKDLGGTIIVNADFQSKIDKKKGHVPLVYFPKNAREIFYASYGEDDSNGKQIYTRKKEPSGAWGEPQLVKGKVNTKYDEDYCYKTQDGKYLYFSSKGHNSMGGYDVFRSQYNPSTDSYEEPENMDFAVSSPQDDIFFLVDAKNENGYFASSRQSEEGKLFVYKIRVDKLPAQLSVIAGIFESKVSTAPSKLKVVVENQAGVNVGEFYSDNTGQIILSFPTGGNYKYKMSLVGSSEIFQAAVTLPYKKDIKPIRQNFVHTNENGKEVIRVMDRFDEAVTEKEDVLATLFSSKANLDPNSDKFDLKSLNGAKEKEEILAEVGASGRSILEVATELENKAKIVRNTEEQAAIVEKKAAVQIQKEISKIKDLDAQIAKNAMTFKSAETNSATRSSLIEETKNLLEEKKKTEQKVGNLLEVNKKVQDNASSYRNLSAEAKNWEAKGAELASFLKADNPAEALKIIANNQETIKTALASNVENYASKTTSEINELDQEIGKLNSRKFNYETSSKDLKNNIDYLERFLVEGKTDNPEATKKNIELKKKDLNKIQEEIKNIESQVIVDAAKKELLSVELSEYMELERRSIPSNAPQLQLVKNQFAELMATPQNADVELLASTIQQTDLNGGSTALNKNKARTTSELLAAVNPDLIKKQSEINQSMLLSPLEKAEKLAIIEQENISLIKGEISKASKLLATNPSNQVALKEKNNLEQLLAQSEKSALDLSKRADSERTNLASNDLTKKVVLESLDKTHLNISDHINNDLNLDEISKLQALNEHDIKLINLAKTRQKEIQGKLAKEPSKSAEYEKELQFLNEILNDKQGLVSYRETEIFNQNNLAKKTNAANVIQESNEELITRISGNYSTQVEALESNTNQTELEKAKERVRLDETLIKALTEEKTKTNKLLNVNPNDESLIAKSLQINELLNEKQQLFASRKSKVTQLEQELVAANANQPKTPTFDNLSQVEQDKAIQEKLNWTYEQEKADLRSKGNSPEERINALILLDKKAQNQLAVEKAKLNPTKQKAEIQTIERLEEKVKSSLSNNQLSLLAVPESKEELVGRIAKNEAASRSALNANSALSLGEKKKKEIAMDQALISVLKNEREKYLRLGEANPQVPELISKATEINSVINTYQESIARNEKELKSMESELAIVSNPASNNGTNNPPPTPNTTANIPVKTKEHETNPYQKPNVSFVLLPKKEQEKWIIYEAKKDYLGAKTQFESLPNPTRKEIEENIILNENLVFALESLKSGLNPDTENSKILAIERVIESTQADVQKDKLKHGITTPTINNPVASRPIDPVTTKPNDPIASKPVDPVTKPVDPIESKPADPVTTKPVEPATTKPTEPIASKPVITKPTDPSIRTKQGISSVDELRKELLKNEADQMRLVQRTEDGLRNQLRVFSEYEKDLLGLDSNYHYLETSKGEDYSTERKLIKEELSTIEFKKRRASISLGELETETVEQKTVLATLKYEDGLLEDMIATENKLRLALSEEVVSLKEARKLEKELFAVIDKRIERENQITLQKVGEEKEANSDKLNKLKGLNSSTVTERLTIDLTEKRIEQLNSETKVLEQNAKKTKSPFEESELLEQAMAKQQEASNILERSFIDAKVERLSNGKVSSLLTLEELEQKKRQLLVEESNNEAQIAAVDLQYRKETNGKAQDKLFQQRDALVQKRKQLNDEMALVDKKIANTPKKADPTLPENAKEKELTYLEERKIAESKEFKELSRLSNDATFLEREISLQIKSIDRDKRDAQQLIQKSIANSNSATDQLIAKKIEQIQVKEVKLTELKKSLSKTQADLKRIAPKDPEQLALLNNLLVRGVVPMSKSDAVDFVPIPKTGFEIKQNNNVATLKPIMAETPTGLMYRVQVGAFSKPVADDVFNEFTPVSAEKRSNGLIVYMAGYFQGNNKAYDAQKSIRNLGYSDAFVVAYCDGQRITLAEAKRLEETNACKAIQVNQIEIQAPAPKDTTKVIITELDYHKGIGAAQAYPVETRKGLFFTVQLGVYNRPVSKETLKDITPLMTKRLPNGQIRYSAGVYVSVEEAFPKRDEAREKGISDAYITAYFNGERITLTEAEELLRNKGAVIIEKTAIGIVKDVQSRIEATNKLEADIQEIVNKKMVAGMNLQLVSKKQYEEFPRDVLNRFNSHASFYYDLNDKRIKSNLYQRIDDIPQIYFLRNELDTLFISDQERLAKVKKKDLRNLTFQIPEAQMGGDLTDFLLRLNYRKEFLMEGNNLKVIIHEVPPAKVQSISDNLRILRIRSEIVDPAQ